MWSKHPKVIGIVRACVKYSFCGGKGGSESNGSVVLAREFDTLLFWFSVIGIG